MEVADGSSDAREVVGFERDTTGFPFGWDRWVILRMEIKTPNFGASRFTPPSEEDGIILARYCDSHFSKHNSAVMVT